MVEEACDQQAMRRALMLAAHAETLNEVPVGAVVTVAGKVVGEGWNHPITGCDPCAHAEVSAIRAACGLLNNYRIPGAQLFVTLEPCLMCLGAIVHARIARVVFAAREPKAGAIVSHPVSERGVFNHQFDWEEGLYAEESRYILQQFFQRRRAEKRALKQSRRVE